MILIEIAHPVGMLGDEDRQTLVDRFTAVVLTADHAPEETMQRARQMTHVGFRELHHWATGHGPVAVDGVPPLIITITLPEAWRAETARPIIGAMRAAVRRVDANRGWDRGVGGLWINLTGIADGSIGLDGKASSANDIVATMTEDYRAAAAAGTQRAIPEGMLVDPMCGMLVRPGPGAVTIELDDGTTLGFCAPGCRDAHRDLQVSGAD